MSTLEPQLDPNLATGAKRRFLPYAPHALDAILPLRVRRVTVDDLDVTEDAVRGDRLRVRPHVVQGWQRVRIEFEMKDVDNELSEHAFPGGAPVPLRHLIRIRCRESRLRRSVALDREDSSYAGVTPVTRAQ